jgi:hypothetical protein
MSAAIMGPAVSTFSNPQFSTNVYGYLGFLLTLGLLPVYVLTNVSAIRYFREIGEFHWLRHGVLPVAGSLLMVGQILEQTAVPYTWFPWLILGWVILVARASSTRRRPGDRARPGPGRAAGGPGGGRSSVRTASTAPDASPDAGRWGSWLGIGSCAWA